MYDEKKQQVDTPMFMAPQDFKQLWHRDYVKCVLCSHEVYAVPFHMMNLCAVLSRSLKCRPISREYQGHLTFLAFVHTDDPWLALSEVCDKEQVLNQRPILVTNNGVSNEY